MAPPHRRRAEEPGRWVLDKIHCEMFHLAVKTGQTVGGRQTLKASEKAPQLAIYRAMARGDEQVTG